MRRLSRISLQLLAGLLLCGSAWAQLDQADPPEASLGDVARSMRKTPAPAPKTVIDNDNFDLVMKEVEARRPVDSTMLFSFDPDGKTFRVSPTPDVTCSLSFNAQATALISDPYVSREMPAEEVAKLAGPATIQGDHLQVSVFNGSAWRLDEITVGLTIVRRAASAAGYYGSAKLVPAASQTVEIAQKAPDSTTLYKMRAAAAPAVITIFQTALNTAPGPDEEWHWAIVQAKGIPPRPGTPEAQSSPTSLP
jgi:dipeptidyl aminopeptidase/acylaminoacyl peptidase